MSESMAPQWRRCVVTAKQSAVKKYVVELSDAERERLSALIHMGKHPARLLTRARLDRRIPDQPLLTDEVEAWQHARNKRHAKADWHFTTADARVKLKRLYPAL